MSFSRPEVLIPRRSIFNPAGEVGEWDTFSPLGTEASFSPPTPEVVPPTNPVPEVMLAAGLLNSLGTPHTWETNLLNGLTIPTWDNRKNGLFYFTFAQDGNPLTPSYPGPGVRVPRGSIFHSKAHGKGPPPHTIHWHGIEPTAINDGVGHCSIEIGDYTFQWQPNYTGFYFYHCHRNTVQHFEFGLWGTLEFHPPDAFFASLNPDGTLNSIPIGAGRDGKFRTAANLRGTPLEFLQDNFNPLDAPDPEGQFPTDPHAFTVPYDIEATWAVDDRDSVWSDFAQDAFAYFPAPGSHPGQDDTFFQGFFNDYNADYWFVTGFPVVPLDHVKKIPNVGAIAANAVIPPGLTSGVGNAQVAINAQVGQTIMIRALDGAYNLATFRFPLDVVVTAFDGRALGVPPFGNYNRAFLLPAGTPIQLSTARRFEAIMHPTAPLNSFATVEFNDTQGVVTSKGIGPLLQTARIPIVIT